MSEQSGPQVHSMIGWLVAGGAAFLAAVVGAFRWVVVTIAREVISEVMKDHQRDPDAHQVAAEKRHEWIEATLERLVKTQAEQHELAALLVQAHNTAADTGTCPVRVRMRRSTDPSDSDMTPLRAGGGHRGKQ